MATVSFDVALRVVLVLAASITFIIVGVAAADFFRWPESHADWRLRTHYGAAIALSLVHVTAIGTTSNGDTGSMVLALVLYGTGLALFLWSQESVKRHPPHVTFAGKAPDGFLDAGPYRHVRHPFYSAYMLIWFAGVVATANKWLMASALWMSIGYAVAAAEEEAAYERTPFAASYRNYRARVGMFLPRLSTRTAGPVAPQPAGDRRAVMLVILFAVMLCAWLVFDALGEAAIEGFAP